MTARTLTIRSIESAKAASPAAGRYELMDSLVPGFGLRVTEKGTKSFFYAYRTKAGKRGRITLGRTEDIELDDAREKAREARRKLRAGGDPGIVPTPPEPPPPAPLVKDLLDLYYARRLRRDTRPKTAKEAERALRKHFVAALGDRPIDTVKRQDLFAMLDHMVEHGAPVHANRVLSLIKTFFGWCVERGYIEVSPAAVIKKPTKEKSRDRVLDRDELVRVWRAAAAMGYPFGPAIKLLILTAQRRDEVGEMPWSEVDRYANVWTIAAERAKNGEAHPVALVPEALAILETLPRGKAPFLFSSNDRTPVSGWSKAKPRIDRLLMAPGELIGPPAPMAPWIFHDLRRSAATMMAELGSGPHIVDKILNHKTGTIRGVAAIYNRADYLPERRQALEGWARHLLDLVEGRTGNVVQLQRA